MNLELKKLKQKWLKDIKTKGSFYDYQKKELITSFIKDLEELQNANLKDFIKK